MNVRGNWLNLDLTDISKGSFSFASRMSSSVSQNPGFPSLAATYSSSGGGFEDAPYPSLLELTPTDLPAANLSLGSASLCFSPTSEAAFFWQSAQDDTRTAYVLAK
jgi:hypothetical protein